MAKTERMVRQLACKRARFGGGFHEWGSWHDNWSQHLAQHLVGGIEYNCIMLQGDQPRNTFTCDYITEVLGCLCGFGFTHKV